MQRPAIQSVDELPVPPGNTVLVDSHCHLDFESFEEDLGPVLERASAARVAHMITIGASGPFDANRAAVDLARVHPQISATVGIHPHEAATVSDQRIDELAAMADAPGVVGIGETGLDYHYDHSPRDRQREAFRRFIDLAKRKQLPVSIHLRNADADAAAVIREEGLGERGGVIHCFSSDRAAAHAFLDLGLHLSFSGILTFKTAGEIRDAAKAAPADRILVETDAPFLAPLPHRGRRNEPALVTRTAALLAEVRGDTLEQVAETTTTNAARLFAIKPQPV